jgi:hypothetical protein
MIAGLLAAYVSTISTHLNWGTSYIVHDFYRRFMKSGAEERHYILVGRLVTGGLMVIASALTFVLTTAQASFNLMLSVGAGTGLIYLLRWYWWRINAWSEIAAMVSSFAVAVAFFIAGKTDAAIPATTSLLHTRWRRRRSWWVAATFMTAPTDRRDARQLLSPRAPGPRQVGNPSARKPPSAHRLTASHTHSSAGCSDASLCIAALFGAGSFLYGRSAQGIMWAGRVRARRRWHDSAHSATCGARRHRIAAPYRARRANRCRPDIRCTSMKAVILARGLGKRMRQADDARQCRRSQPQSQIRASRR